MSRLHEHKIGKVKEEERIKKLKKEQEKLKEQSKLLDLLDK